MYKSQLQELCQRWRWPLPEYNTVKEGPQHLPRFTATVNVNGHTFYTPAPQKSAKEAQNSAAHVAVYNLTTPPAQALNYSSTINYSPVSYPAAVGGYQMAPTQNSMPNYQVADVAQVLPVSPSPSDLPIPTSVLAPRSHQHTNVAHDGMFVRPNLQNTVQIPVAPVSPIQVNKGNYKNLLQRYAQKRTVPLPVYDTKPEGPGHALRFKSKVSVDGQSYETHESFTTLKEAEQAVAKVACEALSLNADQGDDVSYKNLLQELAMKRGLDLPMYTTTTYGLSHKPAFVSVVEVGTLKFQGGEAKTKKQAEMYAAKVAYHALINGSQPENVSTPPSVHQFNYAGSGKPQPENLLRPSPVNQPAVADSGTQKSEEKPLTRKQTHVLGEEAELQSKRVKTSSENVTVNANSADIPSPSHPVLPPISPGLARDEAADAEPVNPVVVLPASTGSSSRIVVVPRKTTLVPPEDSSASVLSISNDQWAAYKVEVSPDPGTTA